MSWLRRILGAIPKIEPHGSFAQQVWQVFVWLGIPGAAGAAMMRLAAASDILVAYAPFSWAAIGFGFAFATVLVVALGLWIAGQTRLRAYGVGATAPSASASEVASAEARIARLESRMDLTGREIAEQSPIIDETRSQLRSLQERLSQISTDLDRIKTEATGRNEEFVQLNSDFLCTLDVVVALTGYITTADLLARRPQLAPVVEHGKITAQSLGEQRMIADDYLARVMIALGGTQWHEDLSKKIQYAVHESDRHIAQMPDSEIPTGMDRNTARSYIIPVTQCNRAIEFFAQKKDDSKEILGSFLGLLEERAARRRQTLT